MNIKAINLDFYGTLVDWLPIWIKVSEIIVNGNNLDLNPKDFALEWRKIQRQLLDEMDFIPYKENILLALRKLCDKYKINNADYEKKLFSEWKNIKPFPEINDTLAKLTSKYKLAICTNSSRDLFDICASKIKASFDYVFISDETKINKPNPNMYKIAISKLDCKPNEIIHVASSQMDVKGATNAGLAVCWINRLKRRIAG